MTLGRQGHPFRRGQGRDLSPSSEQGNRISRSEQAQMAAASAQPVSNGLKTVATSSAKVASSFPAPLPASEGVALSSKRQDIASSTGQENRLSQTKRAQTATAKAQPTGSAPKTATNPSAKGAPSFPAPLPASVFFWNLGTDLLESIIKYLETEAETFQSQLNLTKTGIGIQQLTSLLEETLQNMKRLNN